MIFLKSSYQKKIESLGIPYKFFKNLNKEYKEIIVSIPLFGKKIQISHPYWFVHSVEEIFIQEVYKFETQNKSPIILDCGANWGLSVIYFKNLFTDSQIIAFEPDPKIFELLTENIKIFKFKNVELINKAVWSSNSFLSFSSDGALGGSLSELGINDNITSEIETVRLKEYILDKEIDFLKIDIEGAELEVLADIKEELQNVRFLFVEYHGIPQKPAYLSELLEIIQDSGYKYYIASANELMKNPFIDHKKEFYYELQLNIFCFRK
ncbi:MAG: FkbM family methyltransferase [Chitinophagaceae bacterium]|nr:FkbM family methyltransferase [Chitinophagaceae bacterium]